jgi:5'-nucleotidase
MTVTWSALVGTAAASCTTLAFLPQLVKVRRQGGGDLSWIMLSMYLTGQGLWLAYGLLNRAGAIIAANVASIVLVSAVGVMKAAPRRVSAPGRRRLRIAIDMDEVMADALAEHVRRYNAAFGDTLTVADLRGPLEDCVPADRRDATVAMIDAGFFAELTLLPDCLDVIRELARRHEVFIVTAAMDVPCSFDAKYHWLRRHFPFIPPTHFVFCGDKCIVDADYLIDDSPRHFARFSGSPVLFSAPHNRTETRYPRVGSWRDVRDLFARVEGEPASAGRTVVEETAGVSFAG